MSTEEERDGGPFFPQFIKCDETAITNGGVSLRDWFAGMAISQPISHRPVRIWHRVKAFFGWDFAAPQVCPAANAREAYAVADAMLAVRQRRIDFNTRKAAWRASLAPAEAATDEPSPPPLAGERL